MRDIVKRVWKPVALIGVCVAGLFVLRDCADRGPPDCEVAAQFRHQRRSYDQLLSMLQDDPSVRRVGRNFSESQTDPVGSAGFRHSVLEYRQLMESARIKVIDRSDNGGLYFTVWGTGALDSTFHKGIAWYPRPPETGGRIHYEHVDGDYYVFRDLPDSARGCP